MVVWGSICTRIEFKGLRSDFGSFFSVNLEESGDLKDCFSKGIG
jgi:hypothetical protein